MEERSFYCRECKAVVVGLSVPAGWYLLRRALDGGRDLRLGLYCCVGCLLAAGDAVLEGEEDASRRWDLPTERDRARVVERAETMIRAGRTLPQAAESLKVHPTALRSWLQAAHIPTTIPDPPAVETPKPVSNPVSKPVRTPVSKPAAKSTSTSGGGRSPAVSDQPVAVDAAAERLAQLRGKFPASTSLLHNWRQTGRIAGLEFRDDGGEGPIHAAVFVNTAIAALPDGGGIVERSGRGESKKAAQFAAADALVLALADITTPPPPKPPKPRVVWIPQHVPDQQIPDQQIPDQQVTGLQKTGLQKTVSVAGSVPGGSPVVGSAPGGGSCPGPAGGAAVPVTQQRVLAALTAGHRRTKDIAAAAGMASSNTSTALRHLAAAGLARSTDRGRWEPVS